VQQLYIKKRACEPCDRHILRASFLRIVKTKPIPSFVTHLEMQGTRIDEAQAIHMTSFTRTKLTAYRKRHNRSPQYTPVARVHALAAKNKPKAHILAEPHYVIRAPGIVEETAVYSTC
jgi:hypothetical protein